MKTARIAVLATLAVMLCGSVFAQTSQLPSAIPSGSTASGYGPYDLLNMGTALKTYKMLCFESQPNAGQDTCLFRDVVGHLALYNGAGTVLGGGFSSFPGIYQGTTAVGITDTNYHSLIAAAADVSFPANTIGVVNKTFRIHGDGVYTDAAASLLNAEVMLCQVSGCASGTVVAPAGCTITTTNQANVLTNGQFSIDCTLTGVAVGAASTFMAKGVVCAQLGSATSAANSCFNDTAVALSSGPDETKAEFLNIGFKFSTSNAGNSATLNSLTVIAN